MLIDFLILIVQVRGLHDKIKKLTQERDYFRSQYEKLSAAHAHDLSMQQQQQQQQQQQNGQQLDLSMAGSERYNNGGSLIHHAESSKMASLRY